MPATALTTIHRRGFRPLINTTTPMSPTTIANNASHAN